MAEKRGGFDDALGYAKKESRFHDFWYVKCTEVMLPFILKSLYK
jgi:hypothetical protein